MEPLPLGTFLNESGRVPPWCLQTFSCKKKMACPYVFLISTRAILNRRRCRLHTGKRCSTAIWDESFSFHGTRAMRCGSLLHVCFTNGVCLFIARFSFGPLFAPFVGIRARISVAKAKWNGPFVDSIQHSVSPHIWTSLVWRQLGMQMRIPTMRLLFSLVASSLAFTLCYIYSQMLRSHFFPLSLLPSVFLVFLAVASGTRENKRVTRFLTLCFTCDIIQTVRAHQTRVAVWLGCIRLISLWFYVCSS